MPDKDTWTRIRESLEGLKGVLVALAGVITAGVVVWQLVAPDSTPAAAGSVTPSSATAGTLSDTMPHADSRLDEPSGATLIGNVAYVVDDDEPQVFAYEMVDGRYQWASNIQLTMCAGSTVALDAGVNAARPDDLEGAASYDGRLFVTTGHSWHRAMDAVPQRNMLIEVSVAEPTRGCIVNATNLVPRIAAALDALGSTPGQRVRFAGAEDDTQLEAFAISPDGVAYVGFRDPTLETGGRHYAIVLSVHVDSLFTSAPMTGMLLDIAGEADATLGLTTMEWDAKDQDFLLTATSPADTASTPVPSLWRWRPQHGTHVQRLTSVYPRLPVYAGSLSRPEALVAPADLDWIYLFYDHEDRGGGRVRLHRSEIR